VKDVGNLFQRLELLTSWRSELFAQPQRYRCTGDVLAHLFVFMPWWVRYWDHNVAGVPPRPPGEPHDCDGKGGLVVCIRAAFADCSPFTLSSAKKDTLSLAVATAVVFFSNPLMGGRSNMSWVNMIYHCLIACLGDRGPNSQGHLVKFGSPPVLGKYALWRQRRQVPVCGQVCRHVGPWTDGPSSIEQAL